jgi:prepilin-type N-terminal cleavage/methylation domain-containing protein/prepilin-type processing-associated H-X9-DG protein
MKRWPAPRPVPTRAAFSLIELIIALAIVLILTTLYWGGNSGNNQKKQQKACQKNLEKIFMAMQIYATDHAGKFPSLAGARTSEEPLDMLVPRYNSDTSVFICPGSSASALPAGESIRNHRISYAYYMGRTATDNAQALLSDKQVDTNSKTMGQTVFSANGKPPGNNHYKYGGNFLFCDGHAEISPPQSAFSIGLSQGVVLLNPR